MSMISKRTLSRMLFVSSRHPSRNICTLSCPSQISTAKSKVSSSPRSHCKRPLRSLTPKEKNNDVCIFHQKNLLSLMFLRLLQSEFCKRIEVREFFLLEVEQKRCYVGTLISACKLNKFHDLTDFGITSRSQSQSL